MWTTKRLSRLALTICLLCSMLIAIAIDASVAGVQGTSLGNCTTSTAPGVFPYGHHDPVVFSTNFIGKSVPPGWWVLPSATSFNKYTVHDARNVVFTGGEMQLTNSPDRNGKQQDMGIAGEKALLSASGEMPNGHKGDDLLMAWCARITSDKDVDTAFTLGQSNSRPWPPEIDLTEGIGQILRIIMHWTCDTSIPGCPRTDGVYNGIVAPIGNYKPWPPRGVSVGDHYSCNKITNGAGRQVHNDPSDGHYDYDCRAVFYLSLPKGQSVTNWNEYGAQINPSDDSLWVWIDGQSPVIVTDKACGYQLLYDDNGALPLGQIENGGSSEPCFQASGNWQWSVQQGEQMSRKTVPGLTNGEHDTADVMWFGDYSPPT